MDRENIEFDVLWPGRENKLIAKHDESQSIQLTTTGQSLFLSPEKVPRSSVRKTLDRAPRIFMRRLATFHEVPDMLRILSKMLLIAFDSPQIAAGTPYKYTAARRDSRRPDAIVA
jgi:hypothetical protein